MIENLIMIAIGTIAISFSRTLAQLSVDFQGKFYRIKLGSNIVKFTRVMFIVFGVLFSVLGALAAFDIIRFH